MDRYEFGDPDYWCEWCNQANWEPDPQCAMCHRFQTGTRFDRICGNDSNVKRFRVLEAERYS